MKKYHKENDQRIRRARRLKQLKILNRIKLECGCAHCGYDENPVALQFHHVDKTKKSFTISKSSKPIMIMLRETEKCEVLCANCHAIEEQRQNENSIY